jgi:hypothetical protein
VRQTSQEKVEEGQEVEPGGGTMKRLMITMTVVSSLLLFAGASSASAETPSAWWHVTSASRPSVLPAAREEGGRVVPGEGEIVAKTTNLGDTSASFRGATNRVRILDTLPSGLTATEAVGLTPISDGAGPVPCSVESGSRVSCEFMGGSGEEEEVNGLPPYRWIEVRIKVRVLPGASANGEENKVSVSGGESSVCKLESESSFNCERVSVGPILPASARQSLRVSSEPTRFGVENNELTLASASGGLDTQAGSHPFQATFSTVMNQGADPAPFGGDNPEADTPQVNPAGLTKDLRFKLPPGLVGNPTPIPQCSLAKFVEKRHGHDECPADTAVGVADVSVNLGRGVVGYLEFTVPVFNLEPAFGEPARFGFYLPEAEFGVYIDTGVEAGGDYGVITTVNNIAQGAGYLSSEVTFWGTPGDSRHNSARGWGCIYGAIESSSYVERSLKLRCAAPEAVHPPPFLDLPTSCASSLRTSVEADSWSEPGLYTPPFYAAETPALDGCNRLPFAPEIKVTPDAQEASKPTGLNVDVHVPQEGQLNGQGLAQSSIRDIQVTLPDGVELNPSSADGLQACSENQIGFQGFKEALLEPGVSIPSFSSKLPGSFGSSELLDPGVNFCPNGSKLATVKIKSPLLPNALEGAVYLASQQSFSVFPQENPFESNLAMYVVAEDPTAGILVKLPGKVELGGEAGVEGLAAGQIRSTFEENPQLPFEDAELHFFGGERAPLATPSRCGTYTTDALYTPWSGGAPISSKSSFEINSGPNHTRCVSGGEALPFAPTLTGGGLSVNAGWFSPFDATFSRSSGEQNMQSVEVHLPPGLSGILTGVELCPEPQANLGECAPNSLIGETTVGVGVGGEPYTVSGGKFYLTGPYNGKGACTVGEPGCAPFGITFEVPAKAGPFDFANTRNNHPACDCVLVRGKIEVNPINAAITITSDPAGTPDSIPTSIEGVPLEIQHVNAITTRNDFQFNPTNCNKMEVTGTIHSSEGATDAVSVPFQVTNCAVLGFKPGFQVSTSGKTSRADGASLTVKLTYPKAPFGTQANIAKVKVDLPKQLPSRLPTLQHACPARTFEANPAGCSPDSIVGHATANTPLIPVPLTGPAYFVSYGAAKFPELVIVLQGYGVTLDLHGETFINEKTDITSSTFHTVPDAPVGSFELNLPQSEYSALAANTNLCAVKGGLKMPTLFVAQNGAEIHESTKISVTGCAKSKKGKEKRKGKKASEHRKKKR